MFGTTRSIRSNAFFSLYVREWIFGGHIYLDTNVTPSDDISRS